MFQRLTFRRIISTGSFIPEIDGLRFIAIISVVFYHLDLFFTEKDHHVYRDGLDFSWLQKILHHGYFGVYLFFVISGFILGLPFAKYYLAQGKKISLKKYFLKRVTRLEPPYILVMSLLFLACVFVMHTLTLQEGLKSYFSSIFYVHNFVYGKSVQPLLNAVAWTLEIEIQFYLLAPFIAYIFKIGSPLLRRCILILSIIAFLYTGERIPLPFVSILNFLAYFLAGFLLADFFVLKSKILKRTKFDGLISLGLFVLIWSVDKNNLPTLNQVFLWQTTQLAAVFLFYYYVLFHKSAKLLSVGAITNIGGMCYSIYLLHYALISLIGNQLLRFKFSGLSFINVSIYALIVSCGILIASAIFYLLIERPCMVEDWPSKLIKRIKIMLWPKGRYKPRK